MMEQVGQMERADVRSFSQATGGGQRIVADTIILIATNAQFD
jgi:hypothetical protein